MNPLDEYLNRVYEQYGESAGYERVSTPTYGNYSTAPSPTPTIDVQVPSIYGGDGESRHGRTPDGTIGPYGREALDQVTNEFLGKSSALGTAALALGAPPSMALKLGLTSMGPLGGLTAISRMAYSGLLDKAYSDALDEAGVDQSRVSRSDYDAAMQAMDIAREANRPMEVADVGWDAQMAAGQKHQMDDMSGWGRLGMAFDALKDILAPTSNNMGTTDFSRLTGLHPGLEGTPAGQLAAQTAGLKSHFGDLRGGAAGISGHGGPGAGWDTSAGDGMSTGSGSGTGGGRGGEHESSSEGRGGMGGV